MAGKRIPRYSTRHGFIFAQNCTFHVHEYALIMTLDHQEYIIPVGQLHCIIIGANVKLDEKAIKLITSSDTIIIFTQGLGKMHTICSAFHSEQKTDRLIRQANIISNKRKSEKAIRILLYRRFNKYPPKIYDTVNELRGWEGSLMKEHYEKTMKENNIEWNGRKTGGRWKDIDAINKNISLTNHMLYALVHAGICSLGLQPGLGLLHTGQSSSLVFDIADSLKLDFSIPTAIKITKMEINSDDEVKTHSIIYSEFARLEIFHEIIRLCKEVFDE